MASCDILDLRCIFLNEIFGSVLLAVIFVAMFYFVVASKLRFGFDTTLAMAVPILLIGGMMFAGFSAIYAFITVIIGVMLGWVFQQVIRAR